MTEKERKGRGMQQKVVVGGGGEILPKGDCIMEQGKGGESWGK